MYVVYKVTVRNGRWAETLAHRLLNDVRVTSGHEFFCCPIARIRGVLDEVEAMEENTDICPDG